MNDWNDTSVATLIHNNEKIAVCATVDACCHRVYASAANDGLIDLMVQTSVVEGAGITLHVLNCGKGHVTCWVSCHVEEYGHCHTTMTDLDGQYPVLDTLKPAEETEKMFDVSSAGVWNSCLDNTLGKNIPVNKPLNPRPCAEIGTWSDDIQLGPWSHFAWWTKGTWPSMCCHEPEAEASAWVVRWGTVACNTFANAPHFEKDECAMYPWLGKDPMCTSTSNMPSASGVSSPHHLRWPSWLSIKENTWCPAVDNTICLWDLNLQSVVLTGSGTPPGTVLSRGH